MPIIITNRQRSLRINTPALRKLAACLYALASAAAKKKKGMPEFETIEIVLCGDAEISRVHAAVFNDGATTDVITISYTATPVSGATAEIFVNTRIARDTAPENEFPIARELALYIAHGFDHLAGHTDLLPSARKSMRRRELAWLDACEKQGISDILYSSLI